MGKPLPFLEISPVKFPPPLGGGSYNTACPTATGGPTSAGPTATPASSLPTETPSKPQSDDTSDLPPEVQKWWEDTKLHVWKQGSAPKRFEDLHPQSKRFWMGVYLRETKEHTMVYRGYTVKVPPGMSGRALDDHLEKEVNRMHDEEVARLREQEELKTPKQRGLCDCGLVAKEDCSCENGCNGVTNLDLVQFWERRIPVKQKG